MSQEEQFDPVDKVSRVLDHMHAVADEAHLHALVEAVARIDRPRVLAFLNQYSFNLCWESPEFCEMMLRSDLLVRDGSSINLCMRVLGRNPGINMAGTDVMPMIARAFAGRRVGVIGTVAPYNELAAQWLRDAGLDVVCVLDGFADDASYVKAVRDARPELVFLGMGMPKQERVAARMLEELDFPVLFMNAGAMLDFMANRFPRAPRWMRRLGMEWLYRLMREPRRLWRRYIIGGAYFAFRILRIGIASGEGRRDRGSALSEELGGQGPWPPLSEINDRNPPVFPIGDNDILLLAQRLDASLPASGGRIVQFVSPGPGAGVSTVVRSYASAAALLRRRKILVLSNDMAGVEPLIQVLGADADERAEGGVSHASLFDPTRSYEENCASLVDKSIWERLRTRFDEVVVDARPSFGLITAPHCQGVVVVVEAEATKNSALKKLLGDLAAINANVLGTILNKRRSYLPRAVHDRL